MKKLLFLVAFFTTVCITTVSAQGGQGDPAAMAQRYKDRTKPVLIDKAKLTDAQADKVCDIQIASRSQMRGMRDLSEDDRKKKMADVQADVEKQYKGIPLTDDQIKTVNAVLDDLRKQQMQQRQQQGGNGTGNGK